MNAQDVKDILDVQSILKDEGKVTDPDEHLLASLVNWKNNGSAQIIPAGIDPTRPVNTPIKSSKAAAKPTDDEPAF
jgi:hypothetical protein